MDVKIDDFYDYRGAIVYNRLGRSDSGKKNTHFAKLDSGEIVPYDAAANSPDAYEGWSNSFEYIGEGVIWSVDGVNQNSTRKTHFFRRLTP